MNKTAARHITFHGTTPQGRVEHISMPDIGKSTRLFCLGEAVEIVYRCPKLNGGGDGKLAEYKHKFNRGTKLFADQSGRQWLFIHGKSLKVEEPGIIN
jgi:hypothetical protein